VAPKLCRVFPRSKVAPPPWMMERLINENPQGWGDIEDVLNAPLIGVTGESSWMSVLGMWLTLPFSILIGIFGGICQSCFAALSVGSTCCPTACCSVLGSVQAGNPYCLAYTWWRYMVVMAVALVKNSASRLGMFIWEWEACGKGDYFWHGGGIWSWRYKDVEKILKSQQDRRDAFAAIQACTPDLFASNLLIFLPTGGPESQWWALRTAIHEFFLAQGSPTYQSRLQQLRNQVAQDWPEPAIEDLSDNKRVQKTVVKCIIWMMFGAWLEDEEAETLTPWRTLAPFFILPRLAHRMAFNLGIRKVKKLRMDTVNLIETRGWQQLFTDINNNLGRYKREETVKLCDEIMYVIGFAGIGGTSACVESVGSYLQVKVPKEMKAELIDFGDYPTSEDMVAAYRADPDAYIKETCRIDPPVTSATSILRETLEAELNDKTFTFEPGFMNQYAVSMANRDETVFPNPEVFNPKRTNLSKNFSWNGAFGEGVDENLYPRICPGRYLSMSVCRAIVDHVLQL